MKWQTLVGVACFMMAGLGLALAQDDPFAGATAKAGDSGLQTPDGAGSIRAKRKAVPEMFQGVVEAVKKDDKQFPKVITVTIKIQKEPTAKAAPHNEITKNTSIEFVVFYKEKDGKPDTADENTRENIGAWFLEPKDRVEGIVKEKKDGKFVLELLQRK